MAPDPRKELEVLRGMLKYELPHNAGVRCGLHASQIDALCRKWQAAGWYEPHPSGFDRGFLTAAGRVAVHKMLADGPDAR